MVEKIESEGIVLLKNDGVLPLANAGAKVTLLGRDAADPIYGGSGSGSVDVSTAVNVKTGLENAGLQVNPTVFDLLTLMPAMKAIHVPKSQWTTRVIRPIISVRCRLRLHQRCN